MGATTLYRLTLHYEMCWLAIGSDSNGLNCICCIFIDECLLGRNKLADAVDNIDLTPAPYFDESRGSSWNFRGRNIFVLKASWSFLPRDAMLARYMLLSCVCLSVTSRYCIKTAKHRITQITSHDSSGNLVFWCQRYPRNATRLNPYGGPNAGVGAFRVTWP